MTNEVHFKTGSEILRKILTSPDNMLVYARGDELVLDGWITLTDSEKSWLRSVAEIEDSSEWGLHAVSQEESNDS